MTLVQRKVVLVWCFANFRPSRKGKSDEAPLCFSMRETSNLNVFEFGNILFSYC